MKIFVKPPGEIHFEIEVKPEDTVADVKKNIETVQGSDVYPAAQQKPFHQGGILEDGTTFDENGVVEDSFVVIMLSKGIPEWAEDPPPVSRTALSQQTNRPPVWSMQAAQFAQSAVVPSSGPNANPLNLFSQGLPTVVSNPAGANTFQEFLHNSEHIQALRAMVQANPQILQPLLHQLEKQNPHLMQLIQEHLADFLRLINEPVEGGEGNILGQHAGAMSQTISGLPTVVSNPAGANTFQEFLHGSEHIQALRAMVQANPQILQPLLHELEKQNPHLMQLIQEHLADFLRLINEPVEAGEGNILGQHAGAMSQTISVTPNEREATEHGLPTVVSNPAGANTFQEFLHGSEHIQALRAMVLANPQILQPLFHELEKQNPHLMQLIQEHLTDFLRLINEPVEGGEGNILGQHAGAMSQTISVTPNEREATEHGLPTVVSNPAGANTFQEFLQASEHIQALQAMVQANPQILQPLLHELEKQNPHLMQLIQEHLADFLRLINEPVEAGEGNILGQHAGAMSQTISVTPNEREATEHGLPTVVSNPAGANTFQEFLHGSEHIQALRAMVQANPQVLQPLLHELEKQNPHLMQLIQEHLADFLWLINEPVEGGEGNILGQHAGAMSQTISVTPNEREATEHGLPTVVSNPAGANTFQEFLHGSEHIQALRAMVLANPQILQPLLHELEKQNPHLMQLIQEHLTDFLRLINEPVEGGEGNILGHHAGAMQQSYVRNI